jgi:hypothetical protein
VAPSKPKDIEYGDVWPDEALAPRGGLAGPTSHRVLHVTTNVCFGRGFVVGPAHNLFNVDRAFEPELLAVQSPVPCDRPGGGTGRSRK